MRRFQKLSKSRKRLILLLVVLAAFALSVFLARDWLERQVFKPTDTSNTQGISQPEQADVEVIAQNLNVPWEVAFLPDGRILVTERPGTLKLINQDQPPIEVDGVEHVGEGGLLGLAVHPQFEKNNYIYLYLTTATNDALVNRVERYEFKNNQLANKVSLIGDIPGASFHDGGRIEFGPDGKLYITTGDAGQEELAQNNNSLAGKILRVNDDGSIPKDNPFSNAVYSLGHRNVQGIAWDDGDRLWATEHGPSGTNSGFDELNYIQPGKNYGWPELVGNATREGFVSPRVQSGSDETWAPAGMVYHRGSLFFAGLRGETLYEADMRNRVRGHIDLISHLREEYGRLRAVVKGPDNMFYITTSNTDGRGSPDDTDDKLIRINPAIFE